MAARLVHTQQVVGSSPALATIPFYGQFARSALPKTSQAVRASGIKTRTFPLAPPPYEIRMMD